MNLIKNHEDLQSMENSPVIDKGKDTITNAQISPEKYEPLIDLYTTDIKNIPICFQKSEEAKKAVLLHPSYRGALDFFDQFCINIPKIKFEILNDLNFRERFKDYEVTDLRRYLCFAFIRALELNQVIEVYKDNDLGIPKGTIFFKIPKKNLFLIFNRYSNVNPKLKVICYLKLFLKDKGTTALPYINILNNLDYRDVLYPKMTDEEFESFLTVDVSKSRIYNFTDEFTLSDCKPCIPNQSSYTMIQVGPKNYIWVKICDHILKDRIDRFPKEVSENITNAKEIVHNIIGGGDQRIISNYKVLSVNLNKGDNKIKLRYLVLEASKYYVDLSLNLAVVVITSIDSFFFNSNKEISAADNSLIIKKLNESNKFLSDKVKTSNLKELYPTTLNTLNNDDEFLCYEFPDSESVEIKRYKVIGKEEDTNMIKFTVCDLSELYTKNCNKVEMTKKTPNDLHEVHMINGGFAVIAITSESTKSKVEKGIINSAVTIIPFLCDRDSLYDNTSKMLSKKKYHE